MEFKDYYQIMGLEKTASSEDIRKAYRKLVRKYHPDVSKEADAQERMREVNEANDVLSDIEKRKAYDALYERAQNGHGQWSSQDGFQAPPGWDEGFTFRAGNAPGEESDFSDFFSSLFGSMRHRGQSNAQSASFKTRGEDQRASIEIPLEEALKGTQRDVTLRSLSPDNNGHLQWQPKTLRVKIPAGTHPGQLIRLSGQGMPGQGGGPNGDLYLEIRIAPNPRYIVEGKDIYMSLPLTPTEAALGTQLDIPLPDGHKINLKIPANTRGGSKMRIKDKGFPGNPAGHFFLNIQIALPPANTDAAKKAYEELAKAAPFNPRLF